MNLDNEEWLKKPDYVRARELAREVERLNGISRDMSRYLEHAVNGWQKALDDLDEERHMNHQRVAELIREFQNPSAL